AAAAPAAGPRGAPRHAGHPRAAGRTDRRRRRAARRAAEGPPHRAVRRLARRAAGGDRDRLRGPRAEVDPAAGAVPEPAAAVRLRARDAAALRPGARRAREGPRPPALRSEEHTSELQSRENLVCRLLLEK